MNEKTWTPERPDPTDVSVTCLLRGDQDRDQTAIHGPRVDIRAHVAYFKLSEEMPMATRKKRSRTLQGTPKRLATESGAQRHALPTRKVKGKATPDAKTAAAKKARARTAVSPRLAVAKNKAARAGTKPQPRRAKVGAFINPQAQLAKLSAEAGMTATPRATWRGAGVPTDQRGIEEPTMPEGFFNAYTGLPLTTQDYSDAAQTLGCELAAVKAVAQVETAGASFDMNDRPTILYERHVFSRNTVPRGKFDQTNPDLSASKPYPPGTFGTKDYQFVKLARAYQLDHDAALKAASWGKFQILGENHEACGFAAVADFARAMTISECEHLKAFVKFLLNSPGRLGAIRKKDWTALAVSYNGANYAQYQYDVKLAHAYAEYADVA